MYTADAREQMIEQQVRAWDVLDERVLDVMRQVPRELFVPAAERFRAYADAEVPLSQGQHMLRPSVVGRLLQALLPKAHEQVLQVGAGTGFITACLRGMAGRVRALEVFPQLGTHHGEDDEGAVLGRGLQDRPRGVLRANPRVKPDMCARVGKLQHRSPDVLLGRLSCRVTQNVDASRLQARSLRVITIHVSASTCKLGHASRGPWRPSPARSRRVPGASAPRQRAPAPAARERHCRP